MAAKKKTKSKAKPKRAVAKPKRKAKLVAKSVRSKAKAPASKPVQARAAATKPKAKPKSTARPAPKEKPAPEPIPKPVAAATLQPPVSSVRPGLQKRPDAVAIGVVIVTDGDRVIEESTFYSAAGREEYVQRWEARGYTCRFMPTIH